MEEKVQPRCHENEIDKPGKKDKCPPDQKHPLPGLCEYQNAEKGEEDKKGAGIKTVQACNHYC